MNTVERLCNQLARSKLLAPEAIRTIHKRWRGEAQGAADDFGRFSQWLVANGFLTTFQFGVLQRGFADLLFLDDFKLLERIGQGRMAGVYKAVNQKGQVVAIKVLPPARAKLPSMLARFQREARISVKLKHPNVVRTYQVGKTDSDLHYIVMEYLDGETLDEVLLARKKLPLSEALHVLTQAFQGLAHLDAEGVIHRDLKPGNLMLVPALADTVMRSAVKILDIGLGRALFDEGGPGDERGELTSDGALLGTPQYMAPEQARNAHNADIRADIYSLGCVLYHCLTGQPPFLDTSVVRQVVRHATEPVKPLREFLPDVAPAVQEVMDRLLAKDPAQRYATPAAALKALEGLRRAAPAPEALPVPAGRPAYPVAQPVAPPPAMPAAPSPAIPVAAAPAVEFDAEPFVNLDAPPEPVRSRPVGGAGWLTWRDLIAAAVGACVLLLVQAVLWVVWSRWF
jgi:tRNA A-37 threonylcarbamoyl transferase component Bud32